MDLKRNKTLICKEARSWWVVFKDAEEPWINSMTRKGRGHCFVFTRMKNITMVIEPHLGVVNHILTDAELSDLLVEQKQAGHTVVFFHHAAIPQKLLIRTPMITCASYIAYTMGISFFGITPHQLYKKLIRMGGEEI